MIHLKYYQLDTNNKIISLNLTVINWNSHYVYEIWNNILEPLYKYIKRFKEVELIYLPQLIYGIKIDFVTKTSFIL